MDFLFFLVFLRVAASNVIGPNGECAKYMEWDPVLKKCQDCQYNKVYNETLKKCVDINPTCESGYQFDFEKKKCKDINECSQKADICQINEYCRNLQGSYKCIVKDYCGQGYEFNIETQNCIDINECAQSFKYCDSGMVCENVIGSFNCRPPCPSKKPHYWNSGCHQCQEGYRWNSLINICEDIDECAGPYRLQCEPFKEICVKKSGLSTCVTHCSGGTFKIADICYDTDECAENKHNCTDMQRCNNYFGYFTCTEIKCEAHEKLNNATKECDCKFGFKRNLYTGKCEDLDECDRLIPVCGDKGICKNEIGSYKCQCNPGYEFRNGTCLDIDECVSLNGVCGHLTCENTPGSFKCICKPGYQMSNENVCEDINECTKTPGICRIEEFSLNNKVECFNLVGSYKCIASACPSEYRVLSESSSTKACELRDPLCSYTNSDRCIQILPGNLIYRIIQIRNSETMPYKIAEIPIEGLNYDHYHVGVRIRKAFNTKSKDQLNLTDSIILRPTEDEKAIMVYIMTDLPSSVEIVLGINLKLSFQLTEQIYSLNELHIFVDDEF